MGSGRTSRQDWEIEEQGDAPGEGDIDPDADGLVEVLAALSSLRDEVEQMRCPLGTLDSPARVCKELQFCHAHLKDGEFEGETLSSGFRIECAIYPNYENQRDLCAAFGNWGRGRVCQTCKFLIVRGLLPHGFPNPFCTDPHTIL